MTQEDKELLLRDLCARLPYKVKFAITNEKTETLKSIGITEFDLIPINLFYKEPSFYLINEFGNIEYKPYLRSIHKLTEEELEELEFLTDSDYVDYCNKHYIDYRNLIPKGLALEALEGMYEY